MPLPLLFGSKWRIRPPLILLICFIQQYLFIPFVVYNTFLSILSSLPPASSVTKSAALHLWAFFYPKSGANAVEDVGMVIHERKKVIHERKRLIREHKKVIHERKR